MTVAFVSLICNAYALCFSFYPSFLCLLINKPKLVYVILTPSNPLLYRKMGLAGVYIIFLISVIKHRLWVSVRIASKT